MDGAIPAAGSQDSSGGRSATVKPDQSALLTLLIENTLDYGLFMLDPEGYVVSWNKGAQRITGYTAEEIIGRHFSTFYTEEANERGWPQFELEEAARVGRFEDEGWRVTKDGVRFWANV